MKVQDTFRRGVAACGPETNLAHAAALMFEHDCGFLPVIDAERRAVGVITDRDICIAVGTRPLPAREICVSEVMSLDVHACRPEDPIESALETMAVEKIRRLPVTDAEGRLLGILSLSDALFHRDARNGPAGEDLVDVLRAICERRERVQPTGQSRRVAVASRRR